MNHVIHRIKNLDPMMGKIDLCSISFQTILFLSVSLPLVQHRIPNMDIPPTNTNEDLIRIRNPPNIVDMILPHLIVREKKLSMINYCPKVKHIANYLNERLLLRTERTMRRVNDQVIVRNRETPQISNFLVRNPADERKNRLKPFINKQKILANPSTSNVRRNHPVNPLHQIINDIIPPPPSPSEPKIPPTKHSMRSDSFLFTLQPFVFSRISSEHSDQRKSFNLSYSIV